MKAFFFLSLGKSTKKNGDARKKSSGCSVVYRVYKGVRVTWGSSVVLLKDGKSTAKLKSMIKGVMENGGKIGNRFHWK
jgi:hypothetical protein